MKTVLQLAAVLIPSVFILAALHFVQESMRPLVLPLLLIAASATIAWGMIRFRNRRDLLHDPFGRATRRPGRDPQGPDRAAAWADPDDETDYHYHR